MITVTLTQDGTTLIVKSHYFYSQRIKQIPGAKWDPDIKAWKIDVIYRNMFDKAFYDEVYYKTPRWVIFNEPCPDYSKLYDIDPQIVAPNLKEPYKLYNYQEFGARFAIERINKYGFCMICDGVGLGKTNQALSTIMYRVNNNNVKKILIVCKKSIKRQWKEEMEKFFQDSMNDFEKMIVEGTAKQRKNTYKQYEDADKAIMIMNYQSFLNDERYLALLQYDFVVIDEAHVVSGRSTKTNAAMTRVIQGIPTLMLTGTPIMNKPEQVYGIIGMVNSKYFGPWIKFKEDFIIENFTGRYIQTIGVKNLSKLRAMIQDVMIRRTEYEVSVELPETTEVPVKCELDETQGKLYSAINSKEQELMEQFEKASVSYKMRQNKEDFQKMEMLDAQLKGLIACKQSAADDPRMFHLTNSKYVKDAFEHLVDNNYKISPKVESLIELIQDIVDSDSKVIIFTKFRTSAMLIAQDINKELKLNTLVYTGQENDAVRDTNVKLFKENDDYPVLIGTDAMSEGLNLQVARYVINFNLPDSAAIYTQRIGRARRVSSQFNNVTVYNLLTENSKDEERWENIQKNRDLEGALINVDAIQQQTLINSMKGSG